MRFVLALPAIGLLALAGCTVAPAPVATPTAPVVVPPTPVAPVAPTVNRSAAVGVVNREMAQRLPGTNVGPYTNCVVNNATDAELADLASMAGNSAGASSAVAAIVQRPAAASCIAGVSRAA